MHYIPVTPDTEREMLQAAGVSSFDELISIVPDELRIKEPIGVGDALSEQELLNLSHRIASQNHAAGNQLNFMGGGAYDHFIPAAVDFLAGRSEFYTAYTPYQAEVSQGTLQAMYEFQTMICELSGMDVANASLYDGGSAVAEACSMSLAATRKNKVLLSGTMNPRYIEVIRTYMENRDVEIIILPHENGRTTLDISEELLGNAACVAVQSPNYFGLVEDWTVFSEKISAHPALLIAVSNPTDLSLLKPPGDCGAHIFAGEGQALGNPLSFGGPYLGLMAVKMKLVRKMPGRIIGRTRDLNGKEGFVLTLQTREQHIRRENATSNICTNQGLMALRATIYLSLMGKLNFPALAKMCFDKAHYTAKKISQLPGFSIKYDNRFLKEFVVSCPVSVDRIIKDGEKNGFFLSPVEGDSSDSLLLIAVTEKRSREDIDKLLTFLSAYSETAGVKN